MVASTLALAAAANYPAPFVQGGTANVALVWGGQDASTVDLFAAANIQSSLASALANQASGGSSGGGSTVSGEAYELFTSSSPLLLNASLNSVRTTVTETNLPTVLADGTFSGDVDSDTTFSIDIGTNPRTVFAKEPTSSDDPTVGILVGTTALNYLYNATTTFSKAVCFNCSDSEGEEIELFGQKFTVSSGTTDSDLVLFKSSDTVDLSVGGDAPHPSEEVEIEGTSYLVELVAASDTSATVKLTNQATGEADQKEINEAQSKKILDVEVAVDTADENNFQLTAQVILGASKVTLTDGNEVQIGTSDDPIDGTQVDFTNTIETGNITKLVIQVFAEDGSSDFITPGNAMIDPVFGSFKIDFSGLESDDDRESIEVKVSGNDKMTLGFTNWQGKSVTSQEWVNNESSAWGTSFLGDASDWRIFVQEHSKINETAYAVVGNEDDGYLVRLRTLSNSSSTTPADDQVVFENVFDTTQKWEASITTEGSGTIDIGGKSYSVTYWDDRDGDEDEYVQLNYPDSSANDVIVYPSIETSKGAKLMFYEPLTINITDADFTGAYKNITNLKIPDGDGYSNIVFATAGAGTSNGPLNYTVTVGSGTATHINTSTLASADGLIGAVRYNVTSTGVNNTVTLRIEDGVGGTVITRPAIILLEEQDDANNYEATIVQTGGAGTSDNGIGVSDVDFTWNADAAMDGSAYGSSGLQLESNDDLYVMMDVWGTKVTVDQSTSDQYTATISYPDNQVVANVYVAEEAAIISGGSSSGGSTSLGEIIVEDSEVSQVAAKHLIVIGGSCINEVAATLLGSESALCGSDFEDATTIGSGSFLIETFSSEWGDNRVATLVAGYNAADTTNAATFLRTQTVMTNVGDKYIGTSGTEATLQV